MPLIVDQGNSRWKLASFEALDAGVIESGGNAELASLAAAVSRHLPSDGAAIIASVAPAAMVRSLRDALRAAGVTRVHEVRSTDPLPGVVAGYRDNAQLGVDRVLAMVAARDRCVGPFCVVDAGTAVTVDCVDGHGMHRGGFILPGQRLARECLLARTAIPSDPPIDDPGLFGRDTGSAVAKGARLAVASLVERLVWRELGAADVPVFLGGGDAPSLAPLMPSPCSVVPDLVLHGLAVMVRQGLV
jgi:type III pantothenate kinase